MTTRMPGFGTYKATSIGKDQAVGAWDENGLSVGQGPLDHMTWHCWGLFGIANGKNHAHGFCVGTDPAGDQVVSNVGDEPHPMDQKFTGTSTFTMGTGKFKGITGGHTFVAHSPEFRPAAEGTYLQYTTNQGGRYKLP